ncbi:TRAP transporter small permease subunit [Nocardioides panacisoli]|uniref:TRAP transporter small permease subunit n=1 Tax=Nocardioides panacisoli TaxID=627624 RepID=UPI001C62CD82|nr:TRAP transporter small permease subunit [Nocardioides panacisoli]QYJ03592.1 TRAP transporter small permease subunit [Nocardioides panacisoli]
MTRVLQFLRATSRYLAVSVAVLSGLGVVVLVVMTLLNILLRNSGEGGVPDVVGWGEVGVAAIAYLGLAYAQHLDSHVSTVVVVRMLPRRLQRYVKVFWMVPVCLLVLWMGVETAREAIDSISVREARMGAVPIWPAKAAIAVGVWLLFLELLVQLLDLLFGPARANWSAAAEPDGSQLSDAV